PLTVRRATAELVAQGLVDAKPGHGTFVRRSQQASTDTFDVAWQTVALGAARVSSDAMVELAAPRAGGLLPLSSGYLPVDMQRTGLLGAAVSRALRRPAIWDRAPLEGLESLRTWFARQLHPAFTANDVIICPGSQPAIATSFRALTQPGDVIL